MTASPSGGASAERRSVNRRKTVFSGAIATRGASGGESKAMPPARIDASVCVLMLRPPELSVRSMPLAFQKRESRETSFWYGDSTKIFIESSSRSGSSV